LQRAEPPFIWRSVSGRIIPTFSGRQLVVSGSASTDIPLLGTNEREKYARGIIEGWSQEATIPEERCFPAPVISYCEER
ncbi:MAG: hypothetical protein KY456_02830, partial [Chloroflexi bacterium]|nr:hypothetical protein [Chloroflexota bacterium]